MDEKEKRAFAAGVWAILHKDTQCSGPATCMICEKATLFINMTLDTSYLQYEIEYFAAMLTENLEK